jgi:CheY-like chemotaxis protein
MNNLQEMCNDNCKKRYKLIIMDLGMPNKDGFEASREIL